MGKNLLRHWSCWEHSSLQDVLRHRQVLFIHTDIIITRGEDFYMLKIVRPDGNDSDPGARAEI